MQTFTHYLSEAKISKENLNKVADIFSRIVEKNLSTKLFRYGGPRGFTEIKSGMGILYFYNRRKALRLNYIRGEIQSITLWDNFSTSKPGDYTVDLGGLGLLQAGKKLISVLTRTKTGKIRTQPDYLDESVLTEAKRISPVEFFQLIKDNETNGATVDRISWGALADIAIANDYQIPTAVKSTRIAGTKGATAKYDLRKLLTDISDADKPAVKSEPDYFIKITAQDKETKKFLSVKGDQRASELLQKIAKEVMEPNYKEEVKDPDTLFGIMKNLVQVVCRGNRNSLVVYGGPGIGKCAAPEEIIRIRTKD